MARSLTKAATHSAATVARRSAKQGSSAIIRHRQARLGTDQEGTSVGQDVISGTPRMQRLAQKALAAPSVGKLKLVTKPVRRTFAITVTATIIGWDLVPYLIMVACGIGYAALNIFAAESFASYVIPVETFKLACWGAGAVIGIITLMLAVAQFSITPKVQANHGLAWIVLAVCLAGSLVPYTFFVPWVLVYCLAVIVSQR